MHGADEFLRNLAVVMCTAAVTTVLFQRLKQPVVIGYIIAGLIIGPHVSIPIVADRHTVHTLSELGVILLMFSLGLEFSLRKVARVGGSAGLVAVLEVAVMLWLGYLAGRALGWSVQASIFTGAAMSISSTTIVAKAFAEQNVSGKRREIVFGVLLVEDLIAILLLATLTTVAAGRGLSATALAATTGRLIAFLIGLVVVGLLVVPRFIRAVVQLKRPETTLVAAIGVCFAIALLAHGSGYSVALGAFLAGSLVAESGEAATIEHLVQPVRDMFAAIFFVAVGMQIDPALVARHWVAVVVLTFVVLLGKVLGVSLGAFFTGKGVRAAIQSAMSLAQIGEFSFIIAGLAVSTRAAGQHLYVVAIAVSAVTSLLTPWMIRASDPVATWIDRKMPPRLQTFATLYGSWVEQLGKGGGAPVVRSATRRLVRLLLLDAACLAGTVIAASLWYGKLMSALISKTGVGPQVARAIVVGAVALLAGPLLLGVVRLARQLGMRLALDALPAAEPGKADLAMAPRRVLVVALQTACMLLVGIPLIAVTQPFLPAFQGAIPVAVVLVVLGVVFWRSTANLHGHVRAGAHVIAEALASQSRSNTGKHDAIEPVRELLPGLGTPTPVQIGAGSPAIGRTLKELNLRGLTGATVLAIQRKGAATVIPTAQELLQEGDVLALAGTEEAIGAAIQALAPQAAESAGG